MLAGHFVDESKISFDKHGIKSLERKMNDIYCLGST